MNILVTGGCGFIGSHICISLINSGYSPVILDNLTNSKPSILKRLFQITGKQIPFFEGDVCDTKLLNKIFTDFEIKAVIHLAGLKAVGESVIKPIEYYQNNLTGTLSLIEAMQNHKVYNLIFSSSATVYGEQESPNYVETMQTHVPSSPYGKTKLMAEYILSDVYQSNPKFSISLLRYSNPVGAHSSGIIGEDPQGIPNNLMPFISQVAVGKRESLAIFGKDYPTKDGSCIRDYIHVMDLAEGHISTLKHKLDQSGLHIYNLGTGFGISVIEMVEIFSKVIGQNIPYHFAPRRKGDLAQYWVDPQKALKELGWKTQFSVEQMIEDSWRWQQFSSSTCLDE